MNSQKIQQLQSQTQIFTHRLGHSLEILQVSALELRDALLKELQTNPVLEELPLESFSLDHPPPPSVKDPIFEKSKNWQNDYENQTDSIQKRQHILDSIVAEKSLQEHIMEQAKFSAGTPEELSALEFLVGTLDDKGLLPPPLQELVKLSHFSETIIKNALKILKNCDPPGIGSKNIQECLLVQLEAEGKQNSLAAEIIKNHFPLLLRRRIPELANKLNVNIQEIQEALDEVAILDPTPGRKFQEDNNRLIIADAFVEKSDNKWIVSLNNEYIPKIQLSKTYKDLLAKEGLSDQEKEYIQEKMRSGKHILNAIEQRQKTIERITHALLELQKDFFEKGPSALHPLTMSILANHLNLHETTIGRAIANKFLSTPHGLLPYKYFFTSSISLTHEDKISSTAIKDQIMKIIHSESPKKPYSDQKIVEILSEQNINLSRRTVAKYREELGILSTNLRRQY